MAIHDVWLANLKALVVLEGGGRKGIRAVADAAKLSEEYVYQLVSEKPNKDGARREVGVGAARKIVKAFSAGKSDGWFDAPISDVTHQTMTPNAGSPKGALTVLNTAPTSTSQIATVASHNQAIEIISSALASMTDAQRETMAGKLASLARAPDSPTLKKSISESLGSSASGNAIGNIQTPNFLKR